jgi:uncharacterized membrane protein YhfC
MVSILTILVLCINMIVPIGLLVVLLILLMTKLKPGFRQVAIGAGVFFVFSLVLESLNNHYFLIWNGSSATFFKSNTFVYCLFGGLMAGLFEETGRFAGMKLFFKGKREWKHGVAYGIGHGGLELLYIGGMIALSDLSYLVDSVMINSGTFDQLKKTMPAQSATIDAVKHMLITTPSFDFLAGGVERINTLFFQIALSILVLYAVSKRRYIFYLLAILIHATVDFIVVFTGKLGVNMWLIEGLIFLVAIASVIFIIKSKKLFESEKKTEETPVPVETPQA